MAADILTDDPHLEKGKNTPILQQLKILSKNKPNWSLIS